MCLVSLSDLKFKFERKGLYLSLPFHVDFVSLRLGFQGSSIDGLPQIYFNLKKDPNSKPTKKIVVSGEDPKVCFIPFSGIR